MKLKFKVSIDAFKSKNLDLTRTKIDYDIKNNGEVHFIHTFQDQTDGEDFIKIIGTILVYDKRIDKITEKVYYNQVKIDNESIGRI